MKAAFVIGASGSVGKALVQELIQQAAFSPIVTFGRSAQGLSQISEVLLSMTPKDLEKAVVQEAAKIEGEVVGFSVLGVGANTGKMTINEHRAVDVELNRTFAKGLQRSGKVQHLNYLSAAGANPHASSKGRGAAGFARYNRVKGESEEAVRSQGLAIVSTFRPAMIIGSVHTPSLLAKLIPLFSCITPKNFLSIKTSEIAKSMVAAAIHTPEQSAVYHYPEMMKLISDVR